MANEVTLNFTAEQINVNLENAGNAILHTEQTLTPEQQEQARENIGTCAAPVVLDALAYAESEGGNSVMDYLFSLIGGYGGSAVAYTPENGDYDSDEAVEAVKRLVADVPMDRPCMIYLPYVGCYAHITSVIERENLKEISFTLSFSDEKGMRWANVLINSDAIMSCYTFRAVSYPEPEE